MGETLNLVAVLEDIPPKRLWEDLSNLPYIEETDEGLSIVPYSKLPSSELKKKILQITREGMKLRGYSSKGTNKRIEKILNFEMPEIRRPLFGLMPDQNLLTFTFETEKGMCVEYVEFMIEIIESDLGIEFEPAEEYELGDFSDESEAHNLELLRKIAAEEGFDDEESWYDEDEDEDYPRRYLKDDDDDEYDEDLDDDEQDNPFL